MMLGATAGPVFPCCHQTGKVDTMMWSNAGKYAIAGVKRSVQEMSAPVTIDQSHCRPKTCLRYVILLYDISPQTVMLLYIHIHTVPYPPVTDTMGRTYCKGRFPIPCQHVATTERCQTGIKKNSNKRVISRGADALQK